MINLVVTSVGELYNKSLLDFIQTDFSKNFKLYILTDSPHLFSNFNTTLYYKNTFSYFDKFLFGLKTLSIINDDGFIWDADELHTLESDIHRYDLKDDSIQFAGFWNNYETFDKLLSNQYGYWNFLTSKLDKEKIEYSNIFNIQEDKLWFPKNNYGEFLKCFEDLHIIFINNTIRHGTHKGGVANGEGVALGYSFYKSNLKFKSVYKPNN